MSKAKYFLLIVGLTTGVLSGLFGVGGGILVTLFIALYLNLDQHIAQSTSITITFFASLISSIIYFYYGTLDWDTIILVGLGSIIGGYIGAKVMNYIPSKYLQRFFAIFMLLAGIRMVLS